MNSRFKAPVNNDKAAQLHRINANLKRIADALEDLLQIAKREVEPPRNIPNGNR